MSVHNILSCAQAERSRRQAIAERDALAAELARLTDALREDVQIIADAYCGGNERDLDAAGDAIQRLLALAASGEGTER